MDMENTANYIRLCGTPVARPEKSHRSRGEDFYVFPLEVLRLSGSTDTLNVIVRERLLNETPLGEGRLCVSGELRSFNNRSGEGAKLVISVFAKELRFCGLVDENLVMLSGTLCKEPKLRSTPLGREVCDLMLAVNRSCGRSDYLPCICWGSKAREASMWGVGDKLRLEGRLQSRKYIKVLDGLSHERTAFEVSCSSAELIL